jgi:uncharacterized membrane protein/osmotically-inducible protein OsmY
LQGINKLASEVTVKTMRFLISGAAIGAGLVYLADPVLGKRRRALARDAAIHGAKVVRKAGDITARDTAHRLKGFVRLAEGIFKHEEVNDAVLADRIRTEVGRVSSHPNVEAIVEDGWVTLLGPVVSHEVAAVLEAVQSVRGVRGVVNRTEPYQATETTRMQVPRRRQLDIFQTHWAPSTRLLVGTLGTSMMLSARKLPAGAGILSGLAGLGLLARAAANLDFKRLFGVRAGRRAVELEKTIKIAAPVDRVYSLWTRYENFPLFMSHIKAVRELGHGRSHWVAQGPLGAPFQWNAVITEMIPNKLISWQSEQGSIVQHAGTVRFDPENGKTRVQIRLSYNPPAGALGHVIATLLGSNPKQEMDEDLVQMQTFVVTGKRPHDAVRKRA